MDKRKQLGVEGELMVARSLERQGFTIKEKNYRKPYGEIDVIAKKKNLLIFVEVKRRKNQGFDLSQLITLSKQKKIIRTAKFFILEHKIYNTVYRFDVALVTYDNNNQHQLTYIENAFTEQAR